MCIRTLSTISAANRMEEKDKKKKKKKKISPTTNNKLVPHVPFAL